MVVSPRNVQKYMPPKPMKAPASMADTKHLAPPMEALVTPTASALASVAAGASASGLMDSRSSFTIDMDIPPLS